MPLSNFPGGFSQGIVIRGMPLQLVHPGKVFWVNNSSVYAPGGISGSNEGGNDGSYLKPFRTIDYAIGRCTAGRGDIIVVMPGHAETIAVAAGIDLDVAGVAIIGLGSGSLAPTLTLSAAASDLRINAANCTLYNLRWAPSVTDVVRGINVNGANATIIGMVVPDAGATNEILSLIKSATTTDNATDGLWIEGCRAYATSTAVLEFFEFNGHLNGLVFKDNLIVNEGTAAGTAIAGATGKNLLNAYIGFNKTSAKPTSGNLFIDSDSTASTGVAENNLIGHADVTGAHDNGFTGMGLRLFNNLSVSTASLSGFVLPAIDVDL